MIRKSLFLFAVFMLATIISCKKKELPVVVKMKFAKIDFSKQTHDFGTIKEGDKVKTDFDFINTGETALIITQAFGSCGCTIPEYPREAIKPGEKGVIKISFDSNGKSGAQDKTITIISNTYTGIETLGVKANVTPKSGATQNKQKQK